MSSKQRWLGRDRRWILIAAAFVFMMIGLAPRAVADTPTVSIAGDKATAHVNTPTAREATVHLIVANDQKSAARVTFSAIFGDGKTATVTTRTKSIPGHTNMVVTLKLTKFNYRQVDGQITATVAGGATTTTPLEISRAPSSTDTWLPIVIAAALAAAALVAISILTGGQAWAATELGSAPKWSFQDSWAQNITGLGAVLGTVLGASGFISSELAGLDTAKFLGLSLLAGGLLLVAPLFMIGKPTSFGFLLASTTTLLATFLEFATLAELLRYAHAGTAEGWFLGLLIVAAIALLLTYGVITVKNTILGTRRHHTSTGQLRVMAVADPNAPPTDELFVPLI